MVERGKGDKGHVAQTFYMLGRGKGGKDRSHQLEVFLYIVVRTDSTFFEQGWTW